MHFASEKVVNDGESCLDDEPNAVGAALNNAVERFSDFSMHFASEKVVNDGESCSEKDPDEAEAENPAENDVIELSDFASEKVVNDAMICSEKVDSESFFENELYVDVNGDPSLAQKIDGNGDPSLAHVFQKIDGNGDPPLRSIQDGLKSQLKRHRKAN